MDEYKAWLEEAGVKLPEHRLDRLAGKVARELELRVGDAITDQVSDAQLAEFETVFLEAQRKQAAWLEKNFPDYAKVVAQVSEKLHKELASSKNPAVTVKHWH